MAIYLRVIEEKDLSRLRGWRNTDWLRHTFREYRLLSEVNQQDWFDHISRSREVEMFGIQVNGTLVGVCGLCYICWVNRTAEVSILVVGKYRVIRARAALRLLHKKAFEEFNLHRLWAEIYKFDTPKIALFEHSGYTLEGVLRKHVFKLGRYHDSLIYGLLK